MRVPGLVVEVTQADIDAGRPHSPSCCPLALAIKREVWTPDRVAVYAKTWTGGNLPRDARAFVRHFDSGLPVQPATFWLPVR